MIDRVIDISDEPARLSVRCEQLVVSRDGEDQATLPLADVAVLVVSHPRVSYTQAVLASLVANGGAFVVCDSRHLPVGMLLPLDAHYVQTERFALQAAASVPTRKRLWQQLVRAKIKAQASLLTKLHGDDCGIAALIPQVRSGDPTNVEARASRRYWPALFADKSFRRNRHRDDQNRFLNYGYAILRATVARALCAAGLHPSLGLHHHNRYNSFCLADDVMEPFRPIVDEAVVELVAERGAEAPMDRDARTALLEAIVRRRELQRESRTLFDVLSRVSGSLVEVLEGTRKHLILPEP